MDSQFESKIRYRKGRNEFDFILLDPPWENKSVKRKKQYWTLENEELFKIPVPELTATGCVIGVWVTNKGICNERTILPALFNNDNLPLHMTLMSVPSSIHSIPLRDIMKPYLPETPNCLEIFARNLTPGWCCYGNEVFKHQHMDYFEVFTKDTIIPLYSDMK
ncbi:N(6)-adenine-specific methyltransferase METTL4-like [Mytilus trossulus]|uniref:N(6)-adenine-specific methyltransferase METTL4-like n=1 Tax=Mytilus trossulus TaxID=6551 RepID=UPI0030058FDB